MTLTIPARFRGPERSGNGGVTSGLLAQALAAPSGTPVTVTLRRPPPLDRPLDVVRTAAGVELRDGGELVAEAAPGTLDGAPPSPVPYADAERAAAAYAGRTAHPFPHCFVCGIDRPDGLGLAPGPVGPGRTAAAWTVEETGPVLVWAALDCPGGWTADLPGRPMVLGRMTGRVDALPAVGERCVVVGELRGEQGRKAFSATAAYGADGRLLGEARATWLVVDPAAVNG